LYVSFAGLAAGLSIAALLSAFGLTGALRMRPIKASAECSLQADGA
jgi:hypothetical protein